MLFLRVFSILCLFAANIRASSHWMVTETGLIQSKDDSPFLLTSSYDLLALMNQEIRWQNTFNIYDDLRSRQKIINSLWMELEEQSDFTSHVAENENCKVIGEIEKVDWYATFFEDGKGFEIREKEYMLNTIEVFGEAEVPDCKKISSLTFSMSTFEHLEGMINRGHLNATPEARLPEVFSSVRTVHQYGHWLSEVLRRNTTSWLHYNLAAIYWRIQGNVPKALECSRRAVHYAPRRYKTIPLLCMGSILHRSQQSEDAIIVFRASVDHDPTFALSHLALGEAYAVVGDFNSSIKHINTYIKRNKGFTRGLKYQYAVMCHIDLHTKMQYAQRTLAKLKLELEECGEMETKWFTIHAAILNTMKHNIDYSILNIERNCKKMEEMTSINFKDLQKDRKKNALILHIATSPLYTVQWKKEKGVGAIHIAYELEKAVKHTVKQSGPVDKSHMGYNSLIERNKVEILKEMGPMLSFPEIFPESKKNKGESGTENKEADSKITFQDVPELTLVDQIELTTNPDEKVLYPPDMKVNRNKMDFDTDPEWPSNEFCEEAKPNFPDSIDTVYPIFMPFEHKGISLESLLTDKIGVPALEEHELPWHPPLCPSDKELAHYTARKGIKIALVGDAISEHLRPQLLSYVSRADRRHVNSMQDAEIGQRIHTAMQKKLAPDWVLYTLASLYWRVRGNSANALNCLLGALRCDNRHRDVPLVSLASVLLEAGLWDDALASVEEAYKLSPYEPPTNFMLFQLHMLKKHQRAQAFHLKQALRVDPHYLNGLARSVYNCWACITKQVNTLRQLGADIDGIKDICAETEPGISVVCERDGTNCRRTNKPCSASTSSTLASMLQHREDIQHSLFPHKHLEASFYRVVNAKPLERHDKVGHLKSYDVMMRSIADQIALCKKEDCGVMFNMLDLKKEECPMAVFEFEYWLLYITVQQELSEEEEQILAEISSLTPSSKKIPECRVPAGSERDFFLSRALAADAAGWGALLVLVQHFADLLHHNDFVLLGARLARYVDTEGSSWWGSLVAGWWCGAVGRGACAVRCLAAAHARAPPPARRAALRSLVALLHLQKKTKDAMDLAYLSFYAAPTSKTEAFLVGLSHFHNNEIDEALWMYRYALVYDYTYVPASACLHSALCYLAFEKDGNKKPHQTMN